MDTKVSSMRYDLSFVLRFLFLLSTRIFLSSRFSSLGQRVRHVDRHASHSVVHSGLFDEKFACCRKTDLFFSLVRISYYLNFQRSRQDFIMYLPDKLLAKKMKKKELKKKKMLMEKQAREAEALKDSNESDDETEAEKVEEVLANGKHKSMLRETAPRHPLSSKKGN